MPLEEPQRTGLLQLLYSCFIVVTGRALPDVNFCNFRKKNVNFGGILRMGKVPADPSQHSGLEVYRQYALINCILAVYIFFEFFLKNIRRQPLGTCVGAVSLLQI